MGTIILVIWGAPKCTAMTHLKNKASKTQTSELAGYFKQAWAEGEKLPICYIQFQNVEVIVSFMQCGAQIKYQIFMENKQCFERTIPNFFLKLRAAEGNGLCPVVNHTIFA